MSEQSGLSDLDVAVLLALDDLGARPDRGHLKSARAVDALYANAGIPPLYGYDVMCNLAAPWLVHLRVLDPHGNYGSPDFAAAAARYTEVRLSQIGMLAVAAERGDGPPVPIGLVNGDVHVGGSRPPFDPVRIIDTLERLALDPDLSDDDLVRSVGPPAFPTHCDVGGDLDALVRGETTRLMLFARLTHDTGSGRHPTTPVIVVSSLPPQTSATEIAANIASRAQRPRRDATRSYPALEERVHLPVVDVRDETTGGRDGSRTRLVVVLEPDADPAAAKEQLRNLWGIRVDLNVGLQQPLVDLLRRWVSRVDRDEALDGLTQLRALL